MRLMIHHVNDVHKHNWVTLSSLLLRLQDYGSRLGSHRFVMILTWISLGGGSLRLVMARLRRRRRLLGLVHASLLTHPVVHLPPPPYYPG